MNAFHTVSDEWKKQEETIADQGLTLEHKGKGYKE
jgi:hypothetical protein